MPASQSSRSDPEALLRTTRPAPAFPVGLRQSSRRTGKPQTPPLTRILRPACLFFQKHNSGPPDRLQQFLCTPVERYASCHPLPPPRCSSAGSNSQPDVVPEGDGFLPSDATPQEASASARGQWLRSLPLKEGQRETRWMRTPRPHTEISKPSLQSERAAQVSPTRPTTTSKPSLRKGLFKELRSQGPRPFVLQGTARLCDATPFEHLQLRHLLRGTAQLCDATPSKQ
ncbi:hypothetical protein NDU88_003152 [Pleurodeles waltl]|uniref:Uncharacterized protein n=1 Tax=Pleurodeles waltl TaxID=8319 RepID=A0AAV7RHF2_PLEWA|nr:hypothetical protein NDU88_003152 [Pleurodeles waltl]